MTAWSALRRHWPEYLIEGAGLGLFMVSAGIFGTLLGYPGSPAHAAIDNPFARRCLMGLAMGATAIVLIYSPWGKQSGAHFNPAVTLTFYRLGKVARWDAALYVLSHFAGGVLGIVLVQLLLGDPFTSAPVSFVMTLPGAYGIAAALMAEIAIAALLMTVVLVVSNSPGIARYTGLMAGALVALYITFEDPISGMSLNPARSFASAAAAGRWEHLWIYFLAPPIGMLGAAQVYQWLAGARRVHCAKLHHQNSKRCIFCMGDERPVCPGVRPPQATAQEQWHEATFGHRSPSIAVIAGVIHWACCCNRKGSGSSNSLRTRSFSAVALAGETLEHQ